MATKKLLFACFTDCRESPSELNRELSKKTDKSIDCWLKKYRDHIPEEYKDNIKVIIMAYCYFYYGEMYVNCRFLNQKYR